MTAAYASLFGEDEISVAVAQGNDPCLARWIVDPRHEGLLSSISGMDERALHRWERERQITRHGTVDASITMRGNTAKAVQIRDLSITVTRRKRPVAGAVVPPAGCGGGPSPETLFVDLDSLPVGRAVSGEYLLTSPHQKKARKASAEYNNRKPMSLHRDITMNGTYNLLLVGRTQRHYTEWKATVTWWDGKATHRTTIENDGAPFRVSAAAR